MAISCRDCRFCNTTLPKGISNLGGSATAECRKKTPTAFVGMAQSQLGQAMPAIFGAWPTIDLGTGWCGEGELQEQRS